MFELGKVTITDGAQAVLEESGVEPAVLLEWYGAEAWGLVDELEREGNHAVLEGSVRGMVRGLYPTLAGPVEIVSNPGSWCVVLLPCEPV